MSMSQTGTETQNVQLVKSLYEAFGRGDIQTIVNGMASTVRWEDFVPSQAPQRGLRRGPGEVARFFQDLGGSVQFDRFEPTHFLGQGDRVVVMGTYAGRVLPTGKPFEGSWVHVSTVQNGKVVQWNGYHEHETMRNAYTP